MDAITLDEEHLNLDESLFDLKIEDVDDRMETVHRFVDETNTVSSEKGERRVVGRSLKLLASLIRFVNKDVLGGTHTAFTIKATKNGAVISEGKLAHWLKLLPVFSRLYNHQFGYSPDLRLFFEVYRNHRISRLMTELAKDELERAEIANDFIATLRDEAKRTKLAYRLRQWMRNSVENRKKIRRYLRSLFSTYARLVIVRIDLHLAKESMLSTILADEVYQRIVEKCETDYRLYMDGTSLDEGFDADAMKSFLLIADERDTFLNAMRRKYGKNLAGYLWATELSASGHYHIHGCFMLDGSQIDGNRHEWLAQEMCNLWKQTTKGRGYAFNCNRERYDRPACGIVEYHDAEKIGYLIKTLDYLAKNTQLVRLKSAKGKTFNTGAMPKERVLGSAGRPRSKEAAVIDEEL
jgi:hypothetical protein